MTQPSRSVTTKAAAQTPAMPFLVVPMKPAFWMAVSHQNVIAPSLTTEATLAYAFWRVLVQTTTIVIWLPLCAKRPYVSIPVRGHATQMKSVICYST